MMHFMKQMSLLLYMKIFKNYANLSLTYFSLLSLTIGIFKYKIIN